MSTAPAPVQRRRGCADVTVIPETGATWRSPVDVAHCPGGGGLRDGSFAGGVSPVGFVDGDAVESGAAGGGVGAVGVNTVVIVVGVVSVEVGISLVDGAVIGVLPGRSSDELSHCEATTRRAGRSAEEKRGELRGVFTLGYLRRLCIADLGPPPWSSRELLVFSRLCLRWWPGRSRSKWRLIPRRTCRTCRPGGKSASTGSRRMVVG